MDGAHIGYLVSLAAFGVILGAVGFFFARRERLARERKASTEGKVPHG